MAKVDITIPGERLVESFTALVPQPTAPSTARAPDVGLVELSYVNPTVLVPGPPGPPGPAGSRWYTGVGDPGALPGQFGDMYLDDVTGQIWTYNGVAWVNTGTDLSPDAIELLNKIKTVDGSGSGLDADTLDGQDGAYYLDWDNFTDKPTSFPPTLPIAQSDVTNLVADQTAQNSAIALKAPIASPAFTGNPTAPTPTAGDSDTSLATTAFVQSTVSTAIGGIAPFPEAPVDNKTYGRKNAAWSAVVGGAIISDTAPAGPQVGQMWFESDSGNTYIWYDDGNTQQWVMQNVMPTGPTATGTAAISDGPPTNPVNGTLWYESDTGTLFVYYDDGNTRQWVQAGGITGPAPPMDGNEYVMVNGVWRLKSQGFDLAGKTSQDVLVPTWAAQARVQVWARFPATSATIYVVFSADGVNYFNGAGDYGYAGFTHFSGATAPGTGLVPDTNSTAIPLFNNGDSASTTSRSTVEVNLRKTGGANARWTCSIIGYSYGSGAGTQYTQLQIQGRYRGTDLTTVQMGGVRFLSSGPVITEGSLNVEWLP